MSVFLSSTDSSTLNHTSFSVSLHNLIIIKIGTNVLLSDEGLNKVFLTLLISETASLIRLGKKVILVTSGAVGFGKRILSFAGEKPYSIKTQQGLAAVGQVALMGEYAKRFEAVGLECAQILLSQQDLKDFACFANIKNTFDFLLQHNIIAIVNENDVVATEELRQNGVFSDNDALSVLLAKQLHADLLVFLTSKNGLIGKNGEILTHFTCAEELCKMESSNDGRGGIDSKLQAIFDARSFGCEVFVSGQESFKGFAEGKAGGTRVLISSFLP